VASTFRRILGTGAAKAAPARPAPLQFQHSARSLAERRRGIDARTR
jgi:hypothetical protein